MIKLYISRIWAFKSLILLFDHFFSLEGFDKFKFDQFLVDQKLGM